MVDIAFTGGQETSGVLAATPIPLPEIPQAEAQGDHRNFVIALQQDDAVRADFAFHGADHAIVRRYGQSRPLVPGQRLEILCVDPQGHGCARDQTRKRLLLRDRDNRLGR